eukprot:gnl/TRDRNA2_/TRDRNA2_133105_c0_seq1.p1 gnl/TRDRNA2_/TRDRNA2_133105_c0~~gnl/TRDRNA2_/TRDRNA2_133105_c0_seq1.p1  ORF type:complete len:466 (-),score=80.47 gnl/TRDRNA2_/TRDRNA2_133105_c0_seq1:221-1495(-)
MASADRGLHHLLAEDGEKMGRCEVFWLRISQNLGLAPSDAVYMEEKKKWAELNPDYEHHVSRAPKDLRAKLSFAERSDDCGLLNVEELWTSHSGMKMRSIGAILSIVFVFMNIYALTQANFVDEPIVCDAKHKYFLVSRGIIHLVHSLAAPLRLASEKLTEASGITSQDEAASQFVTAWNNFKDAVGWKCEAQFVGYLEYIGLVVLVWNLVFEIAQVICASCCCCGSGRRRKQTVFFAHIRIFLDLIPKLTVYSGMRLLHYLQPWVLGKDISLYLQREDKCRAIAVFLLTRITCLIIGFDLFLSKYREASKNVLAENLTTQNALIAFMFMRQMLGVVQVPVLVRERLFMFMFAGRNCVMESAEEAQMNVWNAMIAKEVWYKSHNGPGIFLCPIWHYIAVMLSFSDEDFQFLIIARDKKAGTTPA